MNAEAILNQIDEDAKAAARKTLDDANAKAEELKTASREKIEGMHREILAQADRDAAALEQRLLRMAELDDRKELLGEKREMINEAFALAGKKLSAMPARERRAFFLKQLLRFARGDEALSVGAQNADWFDGTLIDEANAALTRAGKEGQLTLAPERLPGCEGFVLTAHGAEIHCTFDALLEETRADMEQAVAADLFGEP